MTAQAVETLVAQLSHAGLNLTQPPLAGGAGNGSFCLVASDFMDFFATRQKKQTGK